MAFAARRVETELKHLSKAGVPQDLVGLGLGLANGDKFLWRANMAGPQGQNLVVDIHVPAEYPFQPPKFVVNTQLQHPNVHSDGRICIPEVGEDWSPALTIVQVLAKINLVLAHPEAPSCKACYFNGIASIARAIAESLIFGV